MNSRTIMLFPKFENIDVINRIRAEYDPLAALVEPHITIVFPLESDMSNETLASVLDRRLAQTETFHIELQGFSMCEDRYGNFLFLDIIKGSDNITAIHDCLYENEFKSFDCGLKYIPHMTVGKLSDTSKLKKAYEEVGKLDCKFTSVIDKVYVEMIGENQESIIVYEKKLMNS